MSPLPSLRVLERAAQQALPEHRLARFRVHQDGWTNLMLEANGRFMFRFPRWPGPAHALQFEVRLLEVLQEHLSIPIPAPIRIATLEKPRGGPFLVCRKLLGAPLDEFPSLGPSELRRLSAFLVQLLRELEDVPSAPLRRIGAEPGDVAAWATKYERVRLRFRKIASRHLSPALRESVERHFKGFFAALRESDYRAVLLHHDLWPSHILWDRASRRPVGVIDWEDARFGDPAFDLTELRGIGAANAKSLTAIRKARRDVAFDERLVFYRRIAPIFGIMFGIETGLSAPTVELEHEFH